MLQVPFVTFLPRDIITLIPTQSIFPYTSHRVASGRNRANKWESCKYTNPLMLTYHDSPPVVPRASPVHPEAVCPPQTGGLEEEAHQEEESHTHPPPIHPGAGGQ